MVWSPRPLSPAVDTPCAACRRSRGRHGAGSFRQLAAGGCVLIGCANVETPACAFRDRRRSSHSTALGAKRSRLVSRFSGRALLGVGAAPWGARGVWGVELLVALATTASADSEVVATDGSWRSKRCFSGAGVLSGVPALHAARPEVGDTLKGRAHEPSAAATGSGRRSSSPRANPCAPRGRRHVDQQFARCRTRTGLAPHRLRCRGAAQAK